MRKFHSYGPVDCHEHFCVPRNHLVQQCFSQLIGNPDKSGHYFTIWAPRQNGKTWLMRQVADNIRTRYPGKFDVFCFSFGVFRGIDFKCTPGSDSIPGVFSELLNEKLPGNPEIKTWKAFRKIFSRTDGLWERPLLLCIDEVDTVSPKFLDIIAGQFRELYLDRENNFLHGMALIGVRAVLGIESERGSPFNVQKSLHVPNLTFEETKELFRQYQEESGQEVQADVVQTLFESVRGQPGLVSWFGELLTEKYNTRPDKPINLSCWKLVYHKACYKEWNNTVLNLVKKSESRYQEKVMELFSTEDIEFKLDKDWCSYLYLNGIIDSKTQKGKDGELHEICRFSSPFIHRRIYNALSDDIVASRMPILPLNPLDDLADVFEAEELNLPALLERYKDYLKRLKAKGINPWKDQPRRTDLHLSEAVGHFHLYAWLQYVLGWQCAVSPEFPTGNGKVDIRIKCSEKIGFIEVKSFIDLARLKDAQTQSAGYARQTGLKRVTLALFVPVDDEDVLEKLSGEKLINGIKVTVCAVGWV